MAESARRYIIFVVDDDALVRRTVQRALRDSAWVLHPFENALEAKQSLAELDPDLVISDNAMPHMFGFDFLLEVRRDRPRTRTMLLSATAGEDRFRQAVADGRIDAVVAKPWREGELKRVVVDLLSCRRDLKQSAEQK